MRRLIPLLLVSLVTAFALATVFISVDRSGRYSYFSTPLNGSTRVVREFHRAIQNTLKAPSYVFTADSYSIAYEAPDRTRGLSPTSDQYVIGEKTYWSLGFDNGVVDQWGEEPLTPLINEIVGPRRVKRVLVVIENLSSVKKVGNGYVAEQVVPAAEVAPFTTSGQALIFWSVKTEGGFVTGIRGVAHGLLSTIVPVHKVHFETVAVRKIQLGTVLYSRFGDVAPITGPPRHKIVKIVACRNTSEFIGGSKYVCGTFLS